MNIRISKNQANRAALLLLQLAGTLSYIVTGIPYYIMIAVSALLILCLRVSKRFPRKYLAWMMIYLFFSALNVCVSVIPSISLGHLRNEFVKLSLVFIFIFGVSTFDRINSSIKQFSYIGVFVSIYVLLQEQTIVWLGREVFDGSVIAFTYILLPATMGTIYCIYENEFGKRITGIAILVFLVFVILCTSSRKTILLPIIFAILYGFLKYSKSPIKLFAILFAATMIAGFFIQIALKTSIVDEVTINRFKSFFEYQMLNSGDKSLIIREEMIQRGWEMFLEKPVLGYGMGTYAEISGFSLYSHNNFIEMLSGGGIILFIVYYGIILYVLVTLIRPSNQLERYFFAAVVTYLFSDYGCVSNFVFPQILIIGEAVRYIEIRKKHQ